MAERKVHGVKYVSKQDRFVLSCGASGKRRVLMTSVKPEAVSRIKRFARNIPVVYVRPEYHKGKVTCRQCIELTDPMRRDRKSLAARSALNAKSRRKKFVPSPPQPTIQLKAVNPNFDLLVSIETQIMNGFNALASKLDLSNVMNGISLVVVLIILGLLLVR